MNNDTNGYNTSSSNRLHPLGGQPTVSHFPKTYDGSQQKPKS